jgi:hypothetical protein
MTNPINGALPPPPPPKQIRFVNNQGQPPSKRRRINAAYVPFVSCIPTPLHRTRLGGHHCCGHCGTSHARHSGEV